MSSCDEHRANIPLLVDGELAQEDYDHLVAHLEHCAACRLALEEEQTLSARIKTARPQISAPDSLRASVERLLHGAEAVATGSSPAPLGSASLRSLRPLLALAAVLLVVAGTAYALHHHRQRNNEVIIQAAIMAHQQLDTKATPLDISSDSPDAVTSWFASRVSFPFHMANAGIASDSRANYKLDGGRLLTIGSERAALVSFHIPHEEVSMLVTPQRVFTASGGKVVISDGIALHTSDRDSIHTVTWNNRGLGYVLIANTSMTDPHTCATCHQGAKANQNTVSKFVTTSDPSWDRSHPRLASVLNVPNISSAH